MENVAYLEIQDFNSDGSLKPYVGQGKPVLLMGQGNFCGHCQKAKPALQQLANSQNQFVVATILSDGDKSEKEASKFFKVWDNQHRGIPAYFGFSSNGKFNTTHQTGRDLESLKKFASSLR